MAKVTQRAQAQADILNIWDHIAGHSPAAADRWVNRLDGTLSLWATQPTMGRRRDELAPGLRSFALGRYTVFVRPLPDGVELVRVLHSSRDVDTEFGG